MDGYWIIISNNKIQCSMFDEICPYSVKVVNEGEKQYMEA